jgi:protein TonB
MALPEPHAGPSDALRLSAANSNMRLRGRPDHAFQDVPACSFAHDDGITPYIGSRSGIGGFPDHPAIHVSVHDDVPDISPDASAAGGGGSVRRLLRSGFGLSVLIHAVVAAGLGLATIRLPDDNALLEGETVVAVEFYSDSDSDVTTRAKQVESEGETTAEMPDEEKPAPQPVREVEKAEPAKPAAEREEKPVQPERADKPVEEPTPLAKTAEATETGDSADEVLSTTEPSAFAIEAATKQIIEATRIEPLADTPPIVIPQEEVEKAEVRPAEPLRHPVSKPRVVREAAKAGPVETPKEKPAVKERPKKKVVAEPKPRERRKADARKTDAREGNSDADADKGSSKADKKAGESQDASRGNSQRKVKGNAATSNYKGLVQKKLERAKKRVRVAGKGNVVVSFTISADGSVVNLRVRKSSGKPAIDKGALDIVRRASPFPALPAESGLKSYPVSVPMTFKGGL